jgi:electron-transferring-flavoprotein dehydrogenase
VSARETLELDILIVGGGPAGMSAALRLAQLQKTQPGEPMAIAVIEKAREPGAHLLSGAVLDPRALAELVPDYRVAGAPIEAEVQEDRVYLLRAGGTLPVPFTPPPLRNHGNAIISLSRFGRWLASLVEAEGVDVFTGFAGSEMLVEGERVVGVRTGDRGIDREGKQKASYEPGVDIRAKVTIVCDGVRGNLTRQLLNRFPLAQGRQPEQYAVGIKELWEIDPERLAAGTVIHTLGHPLRTEEFGGGFIYMMPNGRVSLGLVVGLEYHDPLFDPFAAFQRFKLHPLVSDLLRGGQLVKFGAKALPEGGWNTIPRLWMDGALLAGDCAAFLNSFRLKGIHLAMKSGMLAAETAFEALRAGDTSSDRLREYETRVNASWIREELYPVRNVHQAFSHGLGAGIAFSGWTVVTGGRWPQTLQGHPGHTQMRLLTEYYGRVPKSPEEASNTVRPDRVLTFDKVTSVHYSGTRHDEDQPPHLLVQTDVCYSRCGEEFGHPCQRFCPAHVYEMIEEGGRKRLQINAANCVHCKTCDIMDPYQVITWVPPEGGGGPQYDGM